MLVISSVVTSIAKTSLILTSTAVYLNMTLLPSIYSLNPSSAFMDAHIALINGNNDGAIAAPYRFMRR
jgi:hypothetical protein